MVEQQVSNLLVGVRFSHPASPIIALFFKVKSSTVLGS